MPLILRRDTSEAAFVEALSASILTHHIAEACKLTSIPYCTCGTYHPKDKNKFTLNQSLKSKIVELGLGLGGNHQTFSQVLWLDGYKFDFSRIDTDLLTTVNSCSDNVEFASKITDSFINAAMDEGDGDEKRKSQSRRTTVTLELGKL